MGRTERVEMRFSEPERRRLDRLRGRYSVSAYLRWLIEQEDRRQRSDPGLRLVPPSLDEDD